ncbi:ABC transporter permease [Petrocella atlantisensis]|jgi:NitT/TauT family transport system permease protein|uniref:ABC transporter permease n=1 Tax=Petrocella atlantisensis TaxID=2173034 RepID=A0A3P7P146_9FIRM|nr:ABC transporter permease subunit [Petrocella atlantisensis]VDN49094.1 ABC transporter permease [Petrocella atlantisensis]
MGLKKPLDKVNQHMLKGLWVIIGLVLWEVIVRLQWVNPLLMPSLTKIIKKLLGEIIHGSLLLQAFQSVMLIFLALLLGLVIALIMAYLDYFSEIYRSLFEWLASALNPLPGVALLPIVIMWTGVGLKAVFAIIMHGVVWSLYLNIKTGFNEVDDAYIEVAKNHGASHWQMFHYVLLPNSIQATITGLRIGWSRGWRALISAEMIFGAISTIGGIGWYLYERRSFMDSAGMYAGVVLVVLIGLLVEQFIFDRWLVNLYDKQ